VEKTTVEKATAVETAAGEGTQEWARKAEEDLAGQAMAGAAMEEETTRASTNAMSGSDAETGGAVLEERTGEAADPASIEGAPDRGDMSYLSLEV
jgi:hypothetical protein